jgi:Xaa-Pro aminopeptidase
VSVSISGEGTGPMMPYGEATLLDVPDSALTERRRRVAAAAAAHGIDVVLVTPGPDLRYLTGYDAIPLERLTCLLLPAGGDPVLVVPELERPAALASPAADLEVLSWGETDDPVALCARHLGPGITAMAVDDRMWAEKALRFRDAMPGASQVAAGSLLAEERMVKDAAEVEHLAAAGAAIDAVHARMGEWLRPGRTEREVAFAIERGIMESGHERVDFVIVAAGPNGASPHHAPSRRIIEPGDTVVVDIGGTMPSGYCSDSTRMYAFQAPSQAAQQQYDVLQAAQEAAVSAVAPGVSAHAVDAAARDVIAAAGFGDLFVHRTGHGIGVETHEHPYIVTGNERPLEAGMVFSVEPGIYDPGHQGARIEDIVAVTDSGVRRLNNRPRSLAVLEGRA